MRTNIYEKSLNFPAAEKCVIPRNVAESPDKIIESLSLDSRDTELQLDLGWFLPGCFRLKSGFCLDPAISFAPGASVPLTVLLLILFLFRFHLHG